MSELFQIFFCFLFLFCNFIRIIELNHWFDYSDYIIKIYWMFKNLHQFKLLVRFCFLHIFLQKWHITSIQYEKHYITQWNQIIFSAGSLKPELIETRKKCVSSEEWKFFSFDVFSIFIHKYVRETKIDKDYVIFGNHYIGQFKVIVSLSYSVKKFQSLNKLNHYLNIIYKCHFSFIWRRIKTT